VYVVKTFCSVHRENRETHNCM